jgi:hypothetical protein
MFLSIVAVVLAVVLPLGIERLKRPKLVCAFAAPAPVNDDWYIHVQVINKPIPFPFGLLMLRNTATGCQARLTFQGTSIRGVPASWPAKPDAWTLVLKPDAPPEDMYAYVFDPMKLEQRFRMDVEPSKEGEAIIIALKGDDEPAYAISKASYLDAWRNALRAPQLMLSPGEHKLTVDVAAGSVEGRGEFIVRDVGRARNELSIEQVSPEHPASTAALPEYLKRRKAARGARL